MRYLLICVFFILVQNSYTQNWDIGGEIGGGTLIRHTNKIEFEAAPGNFYGELHVNYRTNEKQPWAKYHRYPTIQLIVRYHQYVDTKILGASFGVYPAILLPVITNDLYPLSLLVGTGITWTSRKFDRINLPVNNAIGSHWNNISITKLELGLPMLYKWETALTMSMTHISNGRTNTPNLGLNTFHIGLRFSQQDRPKRVNVNDNDKVKSWIYRQWYFECGATMGFHQTLKHGGPFYRTYGIQAAVVRSLDPIQRLSAGFEVEYNAETADFILGTYEVDTRKEANRKATSIAFYLRDEFLFGRFGIGITAGIYLKTNRASVPVYNKLDLRYYFGKKEKCSGAYVAGVLKTHFGNAAYLGVGAGYRF